MFSEPGKVPKDWAPETEEQAVERKKKDGSAVRYCQKCRSFKPPRAHHCRTCERCVLRMDHHCVWVNNCVGYGNHKYFYLFLLYVACAVVHYFALVIGRLVSYFKSLPNDSMSPLEAVFIGVMTMFLFPISTVLVGFWCWNTYLVVTNQTTIENHACEREQWDCAKAKIKHYQKYDLGFVANIKSVLGSNPLSWLLPTRPESDGLAYPISHKYVEMRKKLNKALGIPQDGDIEQGRQSTPGGNEEGDVSTGIHSEAPPHPPRRTLDKNVYSKIPMRSFV